MYFSRMYVWRAADSSAPARETNGLCVLNEWSDSLYSWGKLGMICFAMFCNECEEGMVCSVMLCNEGAGGMMCSVMPYDVTGSAEEQPREERWWWRRAQLHPQPRRRPARHPLQVRLLTCPAPMLSTLLLSLPRMVRRIFILGGRF